MKRFACLALLALCVAGCGGSDTDVAGSYTIALTNGANGCNLMSFTPGDSTTGVGVTITQSGEAATADVGGAAALYLNALMGSHVYTGDANGAGIDLQILGTVARTSGNCTFTFNSEITATLDGDALEGEIEYRGAGNGNPDCSQIQDCSSLQDFNGTRPPQ